MGLLFARGPGTSLVHSLDSLRFRHPFVTQVGGQVPQPTLCQSGNLNRWTLLFETRESAHPFVDPLRNKLALAQNYHSLTDVDISH